MANDNGTVRRLTASWFSGLFGLALLLLVLADLIWDDEASGNRGWQGLTAVAGLLVIVGAVMFMKNSFLGGALLLIGLVAGGFLSFWTIAGLVWAVAAFVLVMWAMMTGSGNGYPNSNAPTYRGSGEYYRDRDDEDNGREY